MRAIATVVVLALAGAGCGGEGESAADGPSGVDFEPYECQPLIQGSSSIRQAVSANEPVELAGLIYLWQFYDRRGDDLPDDVREDFETVLEPFDAYYDAIMSGGGAAGTEQLGEVVAGIDREPFVEAATRINAWANNGC